MRKQITKEMLMALKSSGMTQAEMAVELGVSCSTITNLMKKYDIHTKPAVPAEEIEQYKILRQQGMNCNEIAKKFGRVYSTVYRELKAAGLIPDKTPAPDESFLIPRMRTYAKKFRPKTSKIMIKGKIWFDVTDYDVPR